MRERQITICLISLMISCLAGCSGTSFFTLPPFTPAQEQRQLLASAVDRLGQGNETDARDLLERVVAAAPQQGVTDEALFRLSLLLIDDTLENGTGRSLSLLTQLAKDYPNSAWSAQAVSVRTLLQKYDKLQERNRTLKSLKDQNLSLSRSNKELRQSLERLKSLDIDLEQKIRR